MNIYLIEFKKYFNYFCDKLSYYLSKMNFLLHNLIILKFFFFLYIQIPRTKYHFILTMFHNKSNKTSSTIFVTTKAIL